MANSVVTPEESNYLRAVYLSYQVASKALRAYFDKVHPPALLGQHLTYDKKNLKKIKGRVIKIFEWRQLYKGSPVPKSSDYDITLLICLLRNMTPPEPPPPFGFNKLPDKLHTTPGAHLARIKFYRNHLVHVPEGKLTTSDFESLWSELNDAIVGLGGSGFSKEISYAKTNGLDSSLIELLRKLISLERDMELLSTNTNTNTSKIEELYAIKQEMEKKLEDLTFIVNQWMKVFDDRLRELEEESAEPIPRNVREQIKISWDEWRKEKETFVTTNAAKRVYTLIGENNCVIVTGTSGVGKTAAVRSAALLLLQEGYIVVPVSTIKEIIKYCNPSRKTLFVIDDICGKYTLNQFYLMAWRLKLNQIKPLLKSGYCKVIATCRLQVFKDERFRQLSIFKSCECNLNSKELSLSSEEKSRLINAYCGEYAGDVSDICGDKFNSDFFPLLCSLYKKNKHTDIRKFFNNPFQFYDKEIENLLLEDDTGKYKYCCLVLVVLFNNRLKEEILSKENEIKVTQIIEKALSKSKLNKGTSPECLLDSLRVLEGTFLVCEDGCYKTIHGKLFDYMSHYFGKKIIHFLIDHADSQFISERFIWKTSHQTICTEFDINLPDKHIDDYIDRMVKDWSEGKVVGVFNNRNMKSKEFSARLLEHLNQLDTCKQNLLAHMKIDSKYNGTTLTWSCFLDDLNLTRWIINHDVSVNQCSRDGESPLFIACQFGFIDTVKELLNCRADVNKCRNDGVSPLFKACKHGYIDTVKELIKFKADLNKCRFDGASPLIMACYNGNTEIVNELIKCQADLKKRLNNGASPLFSACESGHLNVVILLLEHSSQDSVNTSMHIGMSPLFIATVTNNAEIVQKLLDKNADLDKCVHNKDKFCEAVSNFHNRETKEIVDDYLKWWRNFIAKFASIKVNHYIQESLGNKVLDLTVGSSPLHMACFMGHLDIVKLILDKNPNINITQENGKTPLFLACEFGHADIVNCLIEKGADDTICRNDGKSPLEIASENCHRDVISLLTEQGKESSNIDNL